MDRKTSAKILSEFLGTSLLLMAIVGSGIMATNLTDNKALQLVINEIAAVLMLMVIISIFAARSGAHFNPVITLLERSNGAISTSSTFYYFMAQITGAIFGTMLANMMFGKPGIEISITDRLSTGNFLGEVIATFGLLLVIALGASRAQFLVPAWIGTAYFFTASTSFANPAVTIGRIFTDTYSGISPNSVLGFILAQLLALALIKLILPLIRESM